MKLRPIHILLISWLFLPACNQNPPEEFIDPRSDQALLLKLELEAEGKAFTTKINETQIVLSDPLPFATEEIRIKTLELSEGATTDKKVGDTFRVDQSPISIRVQAEESLSQNNYRLYLNNQNQTHDFITNDHYILHNGVELQIKGVIYTPNYPGNYPWTIERNSNLPTAYNKSILQDIRDIKKMGVNTVRLWSPPPYTYQAIKEEGGLFFLQTIWIDTQAPDFQDAAFKAQTKSYIREIVDRIYAVYTDQKPPLIGYLIGNELKRSSIIATNNAHPDITSYSGPYIQATDINASQAFLAEMADYTKQYEYATYRNLSLVSYANEISTPDIIDVPFLDFRCHNAYSWLRPDLSYLSHIPLTTRGSRSGTLYQGWIEDQKAKYPDIPLLISEMGLSVAPDRSRTGPPNYGYGGNTETEQADAILQNIADIQTANLPLAGVIIHEYLDSWWKFGQVGGQERDQTEEWFGLVKFVPENGWYKTEPRKAYRRLEEVWK
ncbi:MAG: hypothetical protein AAFQ83_23245 [Bacteroidota bacterium]